MKRATLFIAFLMISFFIQAQVTFTNAEKDFTVKFPEQPEYSSSESGDGNDAIPIHNYISMVGSEVLYMVSLAINHQSYVSQGDDLNSILANTAEGFFQALEVTPGPSKKIKNGKIQGQQYSGDNGTYSVIYQVFIYNEKLFQVVAMGIAQDPPKKEVKSFFKSFKILN